jgi:hypothetical protein
MPKYHCPIVAIPTIWVVKTIETNTGIALMCVLCL